MKDPHPMALFRLSVLGPLASRGDLAHGELKRVIQELASREYDVPGSGLQHIAAKTIESWYYTYQRENLDGLVPKTRSDLGKSKLSQAVQEAILAAKRENPSRSLDSLVFFVETTGLAAKGAVPRSSVHRLLQSHGISRPTGAASLPVWRRHARPTRTSEGTPAQNLPGVVDGRCLPPTGAQRLLYRREGAGYRGSAQAGGFEARVAKKTGR